MRSLLAVLASLVVVAACERTPQTSAKTGSAQPSSNTQDPAARVAAEVKAAMTEFSAYSESVIAIMREHGKDCDVAAKHLASRAPVFQALGPRMMKIKESLQALPEPERERIKHESEQAMKEFIARNPDADALTDVAKACETTSPAFADIAPKVMMVKKK